jgi:O-glycosyl hydrolase
MFHQRRMRFACTLSAFLVLAMLVATQLTNAPTAHAASYTVTITPSQKYQTIQGWGTSLAWWANIAGGWTNSKRTALVNALYNPTTGIGLNLLRYNFGADGPGNVCEKQMGAGRNVPSFEPTKGNFVWTNDANQLWIAQAAKAQGADIFEGFVNSPPAWMLNNSCTAGGTVHQDNISSANYGEFATYIATIAKHFHNNFGITLQTVEPFNEPTASWWSSTATQEGMYASRATENAIIPLVAAALKQNGASAYTGVSSPDDYSMSGSIGDYNSYASATKADLVQWNTHGYSGSDADRASAYTNIGQAGNKRLWMSEWGIGAQSSPIAAGLRLSSQILDDEHNLHPASWVAWQAVNEAGDSPNSVWGLAYRDSSNNISYPARYYAMGNYSKYVREGSQMIGNSDASSFTTYSASAKTLTIVTTNSSTSSETVSYNLANFTNVGAAATPHQTSASENLAQLGNVSISSKKFSASLPAQSITTFVISNVS